MSQLLREIKFLTGKFNNFRVTDIVDKFGKL